MSPRTVLFALVGLLIVPTAAFPQKIQRMRLPAGEYRIGGGGGGSWKAPGDTRRPEASRSGSFWLLPGGTGTGSVPLSQLSATAAQTSTTLIPARCIDEELDPPGGKTALAGAGSNLTVEKLKDGQVLDTRNLSDAVSGTDAWLKITGAPGRDYSHIAVEPLQTGYDFKIVAPHGGFFADDSKLAEATASAASKNAALGTTLSILDKLEHSLISAFSEDTDAIESFLEAKQEYEWRYFLNTEKSVNTITARRPKSVRSAFPSVWTDGPALLAFHTAELERPLSSAERSALVELADLTGASLPPSDPPKLDSALTLLKELRRDCRGCASSARIASDVARGMSFSTAVSAARYDWIPEEAWLVRNPELLAIGDYLQHGSASRAERRRNTLAAALRSAPSNRSPSGAQYLAITNGPGGFNIALFDRSGNLTEQSMSVLTRENLKNSTIPVTGRVILVPNAETRSLVSSQLGKGPQRIELYASHVRKLKREAYNQKSTGTGRDKVTILSRNVGDDQRPTVEYLRLEQYGDAHLLAGGKDGDGGDILVDTGKSADLVPRLKEAFKRRQRPPVVRLTITHTDIDHIKGALAILTDPEIEVREVVIGTDGKELGQKAHEVVSLLSKSYRTVSSGTTSMLHFVKEGHQPSVHGYESIETVNHWVVRHPDLAIDLYQMKEPPTPNDSGIFVRVRGGGASQLLTDDATKKSLGALLNSVDPEELRAGTLKWPHHVWFPENPAEKAVLRRLLESVDPHTIILTNVGHSTHSANVGKVKDFVREVLGNDIRVLWTHETGDIRASASGQSERGPHVAVRVGGRAGWLARPLMQWGRPERSSSSLQDRTCWSLSPPVPRISQWCVG